MREMPLYEEAMKAVDELNELYYKQTKDEDTIPFSFCYVSWYMCIEFGQVKLWDNQDYDREQTDDDQYEPLIACIKRRYQELRVNIVKFKP